MIIFQQNEPTETVIIGVEELGQYRHGWVIQVGVKYFPKHAIVGLK